MAFFVKIEYENELAVVKSGVRAESKNNKLTVFDDQGNTVASFSESRVLHWWIGDVQQDSDNGRASTFCAQAWTAYRHLAEPTLWGVSSWWIMPRKQTPENHARAYDLGGLDAAQMS